MELLAALGGLAFMLVSLVIGLRLLLLARRTRELPELAIGLGYLLIGGIGYPLLIVSTRATGLPTAPRIGLLWISLVTTAIATTAIAVFVWRVFRPEAAWARAAVYAFPGLIAASLAFQALGPGLDAALRHQGLGILVYTFLNSCPIAWAGRESFHYHSLLTRRARLGLADPVVADRMRLWGVGNVCALIMNTSSLVGYCFGVDVALDPAGAVVIAALGLVASAATWLAFFPPRGYTRQVLARATR
jgi:hypothetical protein